MVRAKLKRTAPGLAVLAGACAIALTTASPAPATGALESAGVIPGRYIVVYEGPARHIASKTDRREADLGFETRMRYRHALRGFSASLSDAQVQALSADPAVAYVSPVRRYHPAAEVPIAAGDSATTDLQRIGAATATTTRQQSGIAVAVVDTGIQLSHSDLNAAHGTNCAGGSGSSDDFGHGTLVAGIIGAENNGSGIVGVAPGTTLYSVKVFDAMGEGDSETIACGVDWITANHEALGIEVANLSLAGEGEPLGECGSFVLPDAEHEAICESTAAGVTYVVAAGNEGQAIEDPLVPVAPAVYPEVLTVTAMADTDGVGGGLGGESGGCGYGSQSDDTAASFSNFATESETQAHTIAGPGECITSTATGSGYEIGSGTSFATPHVTGVVALCINEAGVAGPCAGRSPAQIIARMRSTAQSFTTADPDYGFVGDPLNPISGRYYGFLVSAASPPPECSDVSVSTDVERDVDINLSCTGEGPLSHEIIAEPSDGELSGLNAASGSVTYSPDEGFVGTDAFDYVASNASGESNEATVRITVRAPSSNFSFEDVRINQSKGTAKLIAEIPAAGRIELLRTKQVKRDVETAGRARQVSLRVRPRGNARRKLTCDTGAAALQRASVVARVKFRPTGGEPRKKRRKIRLAHRC